MTSITRLLQFPFVLSLTLALAVSGCGRGRSVEAFCDSFDSYLDTVVEQADIGATSGLGGSGGGDDQAVIEQYFESIQDAMGELSDHAPEEIEDAVKTASDDIDDLVDALESADFDVNQIDPNVVGRVEGFEAFDRVDVYVLENCDGATAS